MIVFIITLFFLGAAGFFAMKAVRNPDVYLGSIDELNSRSIRHFRLPVLIAAVLCLFLACYPFLFPPRTFQENTLYFLGEDFRLGENERFVIGNDLEEQDMHSGFIVIDGSLFLLENHQGRLRIFVQDPAFTFKVAGYTVPACQYIEIDSLVNRTGGQNRPVKVVITASKGRASRRYLVTYNNHDISQRKGTRKILDVGIRYGRPIERELAYYFEKHLKDKEALQPEQQHRTGEMDAEYKILLTNQPSATELDEIRLYTSTKAGPVLGIISQIKDQNESIAYSLVTPHDRHLIKPGQTVHLSPYSDEDRKILVKIAPKTFLSPGKMIPLLFIIYLIHIWLLSRMMKRRISPASIVIYLVALYLLSFRFIIGLRASTLFPYHHEAFTVSFAGLLLLPLFMVSIALIGTIASSFIKFVCKVYRPHNPKNWLYPLVEIFFLSIFILLLLLRIPSPEGGISLTLGMILSFFWLGMLGLSILIRSFIKLPWFNDKIRAAAYSPSLFAGLSEVEYFQFKSFHPTKRQMAIFFLVVGLAMFLSSGFKISDWVAQHQLNTLLDQGDIKEAVKIPRIFSLSRLLGLLVFLGGAVTLFWLSPLKLCGRIRQFFTDPGSPFIRTVSRFCHDFGETIRDWWCCPAGKLNFVAIAIVMLFGLMNELEALNIGGFRIPLLPIYTFLFIAVASVNTLFIVKRKKQEHKLANLVIACLTLLPLGIYAIASNDMGGIIVLFLPILGVFSLSIKKGRGVTILVVGLVFLLAAPVIIQNLGDSYHRFRLASTLMGREVLYESASKAAHMTRVQIGQMKFYSTAGDSILEGRGYGNAAIIPGLKNTALNDNVYSTLILGEFGVLQGIALLLVFTLFLLAVLGRLYHPDNDSDHFRWADQPSLSQGGMLLGLGLGVFIISVYMMGANTGLLPFTGKNIVFLSLDSTSDLLQNLLLVSIMISLLARNLAVPACQDAPTGPIRISPLSGPDRKIRWIAAAMASVLLAVSLGVGGHGIFQWFDKPPDIIRNQTYNRKMNTLVDAVNRIVDGNRSMSRRPRGQRKTPPLELYKINGSTDEVTDSFRLKLHPQLIKEYFPDYRASFLTDHVNEFNESTGYQRGPFFLVYVGDDRGNSRSKPDNYHLRYDSNYMNIASPFRGLPWDGEIVAEGQRSNIMLKPLGKYPALLPQSDGAFEITPQAENQRTTHPVRLNDLNDIILLERKDVNIDRKISIKVNGYDFTRPSSTLWEPTVLVLKEGDFLQYREGDTMRNYIVHIGGETRLASNKNVNGMQVRGYPVGESFYYARTMDNAILQLMSWFKLKPDEKKIRLTLDVSLNEDIYRIINKLLKERVRRRPRAKLATVTVMDIATGDILAMASAPSLNPNEDQESGIMQYSYILNENRNIRRHPMGSSIKPLFAAAAVASYPELVNLSLSFSQAPTDTMSRGRRRATVHVWKELFGFTFNSSIRALGPSKTYMGMNRPIYIQEFLAGSDNLFESLIATLGLALPEGDNIKLTTTPYHIPRGYASKDIRIGDRQITHIPDFGDRLTKAGDHTQCYKLDNSRLAQNMKSLFDIKVTSVDVASKFDRRLWEPLVSWLKAYVKPSDMKDYNASLASVRALPDLSMIPFNRMHLFRTDFLSSSIGGSLGELTSIKAAEAFARLATGKKVNARFVLPVLTAGDNNDNENNKNDEEGQNGPGTPHLEPLNLPSNQLFISGMRQVFEGSDRYAKMSVTARYEKFNPKLKNLIINERGLRVIGKTGTHFDGAKTDNLITAVIGRQVDRDDKNSLFKEGLVISIYLKDVSLRSSQENVATKLLYELLPGMMDYLKTRRQN